MAADGRDNSCFCDHVRTPVDPFWALFIHVRVCASVCWAAAAAATAGVEYHDKILVRFPFRFVPSVDAVVFGLIVVYTLHLCRDWRDEELQIELIRIM